MHTAVAETSSATSTASSDTTSNRSGATETSRCVVVGMWRHQSPAVCGQTPNVPEKCSDASGPSRSVRARTPLLSPLHDVSRASELPTEEHRGDDRNLQQANGGEHDRVKDVTHDDSPVVRLSDSVSTLCGFALSDPSMFAIRERLKAPRMPVARIARAGCRKAHPST